MPCLSPMSHSVAQCLTLFLISHYTFPIDSKNKSVVLNVMNL